MTFSLFHTNKNCRVNDTIIAYSLIIGEAPGRTWLQEECWSYKPGSNYHSHWVNILAALSADYPDDKT